MIRPVHTLIVLASFTAVVGLGLAGCAADRSSSANAAAGSMAVNAKCACGAPLDGKTYTTYNGQKIGFCGQKCLDEFNAMTDAQKKDEVAKLAKADHPKADHPKADHPKGEHPK